MNKSLLLCAIFAVGGVSTALATEVDPGLPDYAAVQGVSGTVSSVGSDTLANLMTLWGEEFKRFYPGINMQIQAAGSSTAPPALTEGTANFGPMSRLMKTKEIKAFEERHGYKPTPVAVAIDALAVYVNKDNPVAGMTIAEVDAIFSATRKCGHPQDIANWGAFELPAEWSGRPMQLYGRNSVSGTYGYFKSKALCKGDFKDTVNEQPGSASVVQGVTRSVNGVGYSGIGYKTSGVRAIPLAKKAGGEYVDATPDNAVSGAYPLARFLYVYVNKHPNQELAPVTEQFIRMVLSRQGQAVVVKDGYIPMPAKVAQRQFEQLGLK
ncbi:MAG: phosphate ABC transporter substrate-binding protein PstS family protein [Gammaproteobacteria bacterium]|nr:phosphate ABC transporter substrate-binding protein PstS family protein [Gammaproteobacteria bacterium]NNM00864.1 phosphate ABC transporter substrate-binding protein PstS family protein [Gammaproteobacteria bacterium]